MGSIRVLPRKQNFVGILKAVYGLRAAPLSWQYHICSTLKKVGFTRLMSGPHIYNHNTLNVFIYAYVDGILTIGV